MSFTAVSVMEPDPRSEGAEAPFVEPIVDSPEVGVLNRLDSSFLLHLISGRSSKNHDRMVRDSVTTMATTTRTTSFQCGSKYRMAKNTGRCHR